MQLDNVNMVPAEKVCPKRLRHMSGRFRASGGLLPLLAPEGLNTLVTTTEAAGIAGVSVAAISKWKARGILKPSGLDERGSPLYRLGDVARAERQTRNRNWGR